MIPGHGKPWISSPFHLVSWYDMNQFSAESFVKLTSALTQVSQINKVKLDVIIFEPGSDASVAVIRFLEHVSTSLDQIGCSLSKKASNRLSDDLKSSMESLVFSARATELSAIIKDELNAHLFFWVPNERAHFYSKTSKEILGVECLKRFQKTGVEKEAERAARCYAFGEWTACGFHMVRVGDAGVRAFSKAIAYTGTFSWGNVYNAFVQQRDNKSNRGAHWTGNETFLEDTALHLRDIKPYRDEITHFKITYDDKEAEKMMVAIPEFMRRISMRIDEDGNWI